MDLERTVQQAKHAKRRPKEAAQALLRAIRRFNNGLAESAFPVSRPLACLAGNRGFSG
jgi:hypothetical protein